MTLPVFPTLPGLAYSVKWTPRFYNMATQTVASGADIDLALSAYPLHDFELQYEFLRDGNGTVEFKTLMGFVLQIAGSSGRFLFLNPDDNAVTGQVIGTGDGVATTFTLARSFGAGGFAGVEPVGYVNNVGLNVYDNGVLKTLGTHYTVSRTTPGAQTITFLVAPTSSHVITVDMGYWYYCKFPDNAQDFDKFMNGLWSLQKVLIHSCRPGDAAIAATTTYRYFKLNVTASSSGSVFDLIEWQMATSLGGANLIQGKTVSASTGSGASPVSVIVDGSTSGAFESTAIPAWVKVDMGAGNAIAPAEIRLFPNTIAHPQDFQLLGSNDDIGYTSIAAWTGQTYANGAYASFAI
jgi:hypothetical protein